MAELTLISPRSHPLRHLVEGALRNELRLLEVSIARGSQRLQAFEERYGLSSREFMQRYENDEFSETLDYVEWVGEYRLWERLCEKADTLREISFAD